MAQNNPEFIVSLKICQFFFSDWTEENEDEEDINVWEDNWDDDNLDDDFSVQLRYIYMYQIFFTVRKTFYFKMYAF